MSTRIDANGYPIAFKTAAGKTAAGDTRSPLAMGTSGQDIVTAEVRHVGHHQKEAVVEEGRGGPMWQAENAIGLAAAAEKIRGYERAYGPRWRIAPLLDRLSAAINPAWPSS